MAGLIKVLLVDDHAVVRAGYRMLLENSADIEIVAEADSGEFAYKRFVEVHPDVVIMDLSLPGIGGIEAIRRIIARDPNARILVFSMHEDTVFVEQALQAGARGYITKSSAPEVLVEAVNQIASGNIHLDAGIAQRIAFQRVRGKGTPFTELSTREFEIACLLAEGLTTSEIADRLSLSYKTVANYGTQIKSKLGVSSAAELARLAIRYGVVRA
ncbi:MAG: response regulator transcription factor [Gammaproteobacteria bacterium]|nr:response regulator transcription factor [Gammaproteobacteria bacterium]MCI0591079.1 response regulator transcription factor [Gammaproteobacteria bacterium]